MRVRYKKDGMLSASSMFNITALGEVITNDGLASIMELDVWLESMQNWKDMAQAFRDHDLIIDNYNTCFFEPRTEEERKRGHSL